MYRCERPDCPIQRILKDCKTRANTLLPINDRGSLIFEIGCRRMDCSLEVIVQSWRKKNGEIASDYTFLPKPTSN